MRKKHKEEGHTNNERWLLTYSDLITLLMIFFIVMYTLSKVDATKFQALAESLSAAIGGGTPSKVSLQTQSGQSVIALNQGASKQKQNPQDQPNSADSRTIESVKNRIDKFIAQNDIQANVQTDLEERGLVVSIQNTLLFPSGSATITPEAQGILQKLSSMLSTLPNFIRVEGHTDDLPIHTSQFPSNWELSTARAVNVVETLISYGVSPDKLSATGYGQYRPEVPNTSAANRDKNRRVDLVIMRSIYDVTEPQQSNGTNTTGQTSSSAASSSAGSGSVEYSH